MHGASPCSGTTGGGRAGVSSLLSTFMSSETRRKCFLKPGIPQETKVCQAGPSEQHFEPPLCQNTQETEQQSLNCGTKFLQHSHKTVLKPTAPWSIRITEAKLCHSHSVGHGEHSSSFISLGWMEPIGTAFAGHHGQEYIWGHLALLVFNKSTLQAALQLPKHRAKSEQEK